MPEKSKRSPAFRWLVSIIVAAAIVACAVIVVTNQASIAEKKDELAIIQSQIANVKAENEDLEQILEGGDIDGYMEKVAREEYNYAYPDEFRFYDISRN